ncbi:MAG TPA: hypothetical protein VKU38_07070 [Ktedonobacteraceae bacterium]|nr:hypothetical protein [Ktedonobacteraceae bacterium]
MSDFLLPDFHVPELQTADLMMPDFTMPDASLPDPPVPDLMQPAFPPELDVLASSANPELDAAHPASGFPLSMPETPEMSGLPDVPDGAYDPARNMPGTLDSSASSLVSQSPDNRQLPADLAYDVLNSTPDMTTRERHLGMLLLGLEGKMPGKAPEGTGR